MFDGLLGYITTKMLDRVNQQEYYSWLDLEPSQKPFMEYLYLQVENDSSVVSIRPLIMGILQYSLSSCMFEKNTTATNLKNYSTF